MARPCYPTAPALVGTSPLPQPAQAIGELPQWAEDARFAQHLVVNVPDMQSAIEFYTLGLQAQVSKRGGLRHRWCLSVRACAATPFMCQPTPTTHHA